MSINAAKTKLNATSKKLGKLSVGRFEKQTERRITTGIRELDGLLPHGGLLRGHMSEMVGEVGSGRTSFVLHLARQLASEGERTAIIDMEWDLDPTTFSRAGLRAGSVWVVFPRRLDDALWAADLLVRSGHFGLVVLDGVSQSIRTGALVRLQRQARETETALLIGSTGRSVVAPGSTQLRFRRIGLDWERGLGRLIAPQTTRVGVQVGKRPGEAVAQFVCSDTPLLGNHADVPDRRAAKWTEGKRRRAGPPNARPSVHNVVLH